MKCQICNKQVSHPYEFFERKLSFKPNAMVFACSECFNLWALDKWDEVYVRLREKIKPIIEKDKKAVKQD